MTNRYMDEMSKQAGIFQNSVQAARNFANSPGLRAGASKIKGAVASVPGKLRGEVTGWMDEQKFRAMDPDDRISHFRGVLSDSMNGLKQGTVSHAQHLETTRAVAEGLRRTLKEAGATNDMVSDFTRVAKAHINPGSKTGSVSLKLPAGKVGEHAIVNTADNIIDHLRGVLQSGKNPNAPLERLNYLQNNVGRKWINLDSSTPGALEVDGRIKDVMQQAGVEGKHIKAFGNLHDDWQKGQFKGHVVIKGFMPTRLSPEESLHRYAKDKVSKAIEDAAPAEIPTPVAPPAPRERIDTPAIESGHLASFTGANTDSVLRHTVAKASGNDKLAYNDHMKALGSLDEQGQVQYLRGIHADTAPLENSIRARGHSRLAVGGGVATAAGITALATRPSSNNS